MNGLAERTRDVAVCICAGAGGVGKTTTSAAIALGLAARGRRVAVVTIDPARRLADALAVGDLGPEPQRVAGDAFERFGLELDGELSAMMLDPKSVFDALVERLSPDERTRDDILGNRIYRRLSDAVAGSQEFTAMAKLHELWESGDYDTIVLDTPPSRNALDFLDAPDRLTAFFDNRALRAILFPTGIAAKVAGRSTGAIFGVLGRLTGSDLLKESQVFFGATGTILDGFRSQAKAVSKLLASDGTAFFVITSPEREPADEAIFFAEKVREAGTRFRGLVINRVTPDPPERVDESRLAKLLGDDARLAAKVARTVGEAHALADRDKAQIGRLAERTGDSDPVIVHQLAGEASRAEGLVEISRRLFGD